MSRTPTSGRTTSSVWNLLGSGEDSYSGQNAQNPRTSRKCQSWIPQEDGQLHRELVEPLYLPTTLSGPVVGLYEFDQVVSGVITRRYFAAARTNNTVGTKTCNFYQNVTGAWTAVSAVGVLSDAPMCVTQENNFFLADGTNNWMYDGSAWVKVGLTLYPGSVNSTPSQTFPAGTNGPVAVVASSAASNPVIIGNVTASFFAETGQQGGFGLYFPAGTPGATAVNNSFLFNPTAFNGTFDPNQQPMKWATLDTAGNITGYTTPFASATHDYNMVVVGQIYVPQAGVYNVEIAHDDGMIWGISNGSTFGLAPSASGPASDPYNHGATALNGYGKASVGGVFCGGTNKSGVRIENFAINFPKADTYTVEIDYTNWQNEQVLTLNMALAPGVPKHIPPGTAVASGGINAAIGRYYWFTQEDQTAGRITESDSSPISNLTGPLVGANQNVYPFGGKYSCTTGSPTVTVASDTVTGQPPSNGGDATNPQLQYLVGKVLYINGTLIGTITGFTTTGSLNYLATLTLAANSASTIANGYAVICDSRATHWNVYASESDGSKIGQFLASVPVTQNLKTTPFVDSSPFLDDSTNQFLPVYRPVRNDPPPPSKLLEVHKVRQWRRRESAPNFFNFTANEEVTSGDNGDAAQCVPGADVNTLSDLVNEVSFPDQSSRLRGLVSHADALYMFSEGQCYPLYGQSVDDFAISQVVAFSLGLAGRFAAKSTPHGLMFMSYDRRFFLYPSSPYASYLSQSGSATSALQEIGRPMRIKFATIDPTRLDEVVVVHYHFGIRDWAVVSFPDKNNVYSCYAYDFNTKGWFQLQRGFSSLEIFEVSEGNMALVGGAPDGKTYVIDDQTGTYSTSGTLPQSIFRPALIDFGNPDAAHVFRFLEIEFDSAAMEKDITVTVWLDPINVDSPGVGKTIQLAPAMGANRFRAFSNGGSTCQRMLLEISAKASANPGVIRGLRLGADTIGGLMPSNQART